VLLWSGDHCANALAIYKIARAGMIEFYGKLGRHIAY